MTRKSGKLCQMFKTSIYVKIYQNSEKKNIKNVRNPLKFVKNPPKFLKNLKIRLNVYNIQKT